MTLSPSFATSSGACSAASSSLTSFQAGIEGAGDERHFRNARFQNGFHDGGHQNRIAEPVRCVRCFADGILQRMHGCSSGGGERHAGEQARKRHVFAALPIARDREPRSAVTCAISLIACIASASDAGFFPTKIACGERPSGILAQIGLDGVAERIHAGVRSDMRRARNDQRRIDNSPFGNDAACGDADLHEAVRIGDDGDRADFRARARSRRNADHVDDRARARYARRNTSSAGRRISAGSRCVLARSMLLPPPTPIMTSGLNWRAASAHVSISLRSISGRPSGNTRTSAPPSFSRRFDFVGDAALDDVLVAAHHHPLAEFFRDGAEFFEDSPAEKHATGRGKTPVAITCRLWSGVALRHAKPPRDAESHLRAVLPAACIQDRREPITCLNPVPGRDARSSSRYFFTPAASVSAAGERFRIHHDEQVADSAAVSASSVPRTSLPVGMPGSKPGQHCDRDAEAITFRSAGGTERTVQAPRPDRSWALPSLSTAQPSGIFSPRCLSAMILAHGADGSRHVEQERTGIAGNADRDGICSDQSFGSAEWMNQSFGRRKGNADESFLSAPLGVVADHADMRRVAHSQQRRCRVFARRESVLSSEVSQMAVPKPSLPSTFRTASAVQVSFRLDVDLQQALLDARRP